MLQLRSLIHWKGLNLSGKTNKCYSVWFRCRTLNCFFTIILKKKRDYSFRSVYSVLQCTLKTKKLVSKMKNLTKNYFTLFVTSLNKLKNISFHFFSGCLNISNNWIEKRIEHSNFIPRYEMLSTWDRNHI